MQVTSVVRQGQVLLIAALFVLPFAFGLLWVLGYALQLPVFGSGYLALAGVFLMLLAAAMIIACLLSYTIRAAVGPDGITSGEVGGRWSVGWPEVVRVWIVSYRGQQFVALLPPPGAPAVRTAWRGRRMGLPEGTRTVRIAPESVAGVVAAVTAYRGAPPQTHAG